MTQAALGVATVVRAPAVKRLRPVARGAVSLTLNSFQLLMRKWVTLAPYNAGQLMLVTGAPDLQRWREAFDATAAEVGLGIPQFSIDDRVVTFHPGALGQIATVEDLVGHITADMNLPFRDGELPIRAFVKNNEDQTHYFGITYDHWIADSRAMRLFLERVFARYASTENASGLTALEFPKHTFLELFAKHIGPFPKLATVGESLRNLRRHMHAFRINLANPLDFNAQCVLRRLPDGLVTRIHKKAKQYGGSVNDFFLAVLGQVMGEFTAAGRYRHRRHLRRRGGVGLGTIVDIRDASVHNLDRTFGLYLSSYTIVLSQPEKKSLAALVKQISSFTTALKKSYGTVRAYLGLAMAKVWWDFYPDVRNKALLFQKNVPLTAGISNVNLTGAWMDQVAGDGVKGPVVLDYLRVSPTGPLLPIVFTLTTIRERLSLCVTYRTTAFKAQEAEKIIDAFIAALIAAAE